MFAFSTAERTVQGEQWKPPARHNRRRRPVRRAADWRQSASLLDQSITTNVKRMRSRKAMRHAIATNALQSSEIALCNSLIR